MFHEEYKDAIDEYDKYVYFGASMYPWPWFRFEGFPLSQKQRLEFSFDKRTKL